MQALRTSESEFSGSGWPTPTTAPEALNLGSNMTSAPPSLGERAKGWPTPVATDSERTSLTHVRGEGNPTLLGAAQGWPTPTSNDSKSSARAEYDWGRPGVTLTDAMRMWPTPDATVSNDAEEPETWRARQEQLKAKGVNGNGAGVPLAIASKEWPTPRASEGEKGGPNGRDSSGTPHLSSSAAMWATPTASDGLSGPGTAASAEGAPNLRTMAATSSHQDPTTETAGEPTSSGGPVLNPRFVEALMGFPLGWTDSAPSETPSSRRRRTELSRSLHSAASRLADQLEAHRR